MSSSATETQNLPLSSGGIILQSAWQKFRFSYITIYIAGSMGLFAMLFVPQDAVTIAIGSTPEFLASWAVMYALTFLFLITLLLRGYRLSRLDVVLIAPPAFCLLSAGWSTDALKSVMYGTALVMNAVFVAYVVRTTSREVFVRYLATMIVLYSAAGLICALVGLEAAYYYDAAQRLTVIGTVPVRGLSNHKITAGVQAAIGIILVVILFRGWRRSIYAVFLSTYVLLTGSVVALAAMIIGISGAISFGVARRCRIRREEFILLASIGSLGLLVVGYFQIEALLELVGRDATLTGRTLLWELGVSAAAERPVLGWGYVGFIGSEQGQIANRSVADFYHYEIPHFHNSYIQTAVELGVPFCFVVSIMFIWCAWSWYLSYYTSRSSSSLSLSVVVSMLGICGVFMNIFYRYNDFFYYPYDVCIGI